MAIIKDILNRLTGQLDQAAGVKTSERPIPVKKKVTPLNMDTALFAFLGGDPSKMDTIFNKIALDEQIDACVSLRNSATSMLNLGFACAEEGSEVDKQVEFLENVFAEIEVDQLLEAILEARYRLFKVIEPRWKLDGQLLLTGFTAHDNDLFCFDRENIYISGKGGQKVPFANRPGEEFKAVKVRANKSIFLRCLRPYIRKTFGDESWAHFIEVFSDPFRVGKYPDGAGKEIREQVWEAVYNLGQDGAAAMPASASIEFVENSRTGDDTFGQFVENAEQSISKAILGHSSAIDSTPGKLGEEGNALAAREDLVASDRMFVLRWLKQGFIRYQLDFNFAKPAPIIPILTENEVISRDELRTALRLYWEMGGEIDPLQFKDMGVEVQDGAPLLKKTTDFVF